MPLGSLPGRVEIPFGTCDALLDSHVLSDTTMHTYPPDMGMMRLTQSIIWTGLFKYETRPRSCHWASRVRKPAKRRLILSLLSKLSQAGGKTQLEEQLINGTQVRDAPLLAIYVASGANLPQRSLLLSLFFAQHARFARSGIEFRGSSLVSFLRPWAHQHAGKGRIGG